MKRIIISLIALSAVVVTAQEEVAQPGTPAMLEAANGKKIKVFLQSLEAGNLTFQPFKSPKNMTVPADKIKNLQFFPKYDEAAVTADFIAGDFQKVIDVLSPVVGDFIQYMPIDNNMREAFVLTYNCYKSIGDFDSATQYAEMLMACEDEELKLKGQIGLALIALEQENFSKAEQIHAELGEDLPVASLYLKAAIARAKGEPKVAIQTVTTLIENYGNDQNWLPASELLVAYCYLDMTGTNSVISTNSAMNTARQVKNMYAGTAVAVNAEQLWTQLGGPAVEAEVAAEKAVAEAIRKEVKAKRAAEEKVRKEAQAAKKAAKKAEAKAAKKAEAEAAGQTGVSTNTVTEIESE